MKRKRIPLRVQLDAALLQLGLDPATAELDHTPALAARARYPDGDYYPDELNPVYLVWRSREEHAHKTNVDNGTGRSDKGEIAHSKRVRQKQEQHLWRMAMPKTKTSQKRRWPSRPFPKRPEK